LEKKKGDLPGEPFTHSSLGAAPVRKGEKRNRFVSDLKKRIEIE
jgi:hypothetical protein